MHANMMLATDNKKVPTHLLTYLAPPSSQQTRRSTVNKGP
jgi:hypothetical protein